MSIDELSSDAAENIWATSNFAGGGIIYTQADVDEMASIIRSTFAPQGRKIDRLVDEARRVTSERDAALAECERLKGLQLANALEAANTEAYAKEVAENAALRSRLEAADGLIDGYAAGFDTQHEEIERLTTRLAEAERLLRDAQPFLKNNWVCNFALLDRFDAFLAAQEPTV